MIGDQDYTGGSDHSGQPFKWPKPAADTPAPIATPEEVEQRDLVLKIDHAANAWYIAPPARMPPPYARQTHVGAIVDWASDGSFAGLEIVWDTAALTSSNAEIERLKERLRSAEATVDTFMRAQEHYREAMDERNTFKNAARAAEAQAEASSLTARRDGERDGLLKAADLIDARERDAHAEAALRAQDGDRAGDMHWCAKSLALNQAAKTLRALASTVPGGEEPS